MASPVEVIPSASRLIRSLRDMGYDFSQAIADLVDNSLNASASKIDVDMVFDGDDSWVQIADNGSGMNPEALREAMRYGSAQEYGEDDLGKFGLGLKTASMSQAQRLVVASRWNRGRADICSYSWDLDHVKKTDRWEILPVERSELPGQMSGLLKEGRGTIVYWQRLDRILGFKHPYGESARKRLSQMCRDLEHHLGMVFHRFLSRDHRRVRMSVNGNEVREWDPFCRSEPKATPHQPRSFPVDYEGVQGEVTLEPFILPHQSDFSSQDAFRAAAGPAGWNQQQGFYFYRANRMVQSGGWSNLRAPDEHTKLARIAVRFSPRLDDAFKINVAKMRVQLPAQIREDVKAFLAPLTKLARQVYDRRENNGHREGTTDSSTATGTTRNRQSTGNARESDSRLTLHQWSAKMRRVAHVSERPVVERVLRRLADE